MYYRLLVFDRLQSGIASLHVQLIHELIIYNTTTPVWVLAVSKEAVYGTGTSVTNNPGICTCTLATRSAELMCLPDTCTALSDVVSLVK